MPLPKGFRKNIKLNESKVGFERRQELLDDIDNQGTFLPRGVGYEEMDGDMIKMVNDDISFVIDGDKVPVFFFSIQKWAEFNATWKHTDDHKNIKLPFITVVRVNKVSPGTNQAGNWNEVGQRSYTYVKIPTFEGGRKGVDVYKIPQPTSVDIEYEVRLFCNRMQHINKFNVIIQELFNSRQHYIFPNEHPMPVHLEGIEDESVIEDFNKRRYYVQMINLELLGYILDEDKYEIIPTVNRLVVNESIIEPKVKTKIEIKVDNNVRTLNYSFLIKPKTNNRFDFKAEYDTRFTNVMIGDNLENLTFRVNGTPATIPFVVMAGDVINVKFVKDFYTTAEFELNGTIL